MQQNIYDNPTFFASYQAMRASAAELNQVIEQPAVRSLLPDLGGKDVLDLGCGTGILCRYLVRRGAKHVIGVDISSKMLEIARYETNDERISFVKSAIEDFDFGSERFDLAVSSLAFHYIADLDFIFSKINACLKQDGLLVFSMEHPVITCSQGIHPGWETDEAGQKKFWQVDAYSSEGIRRSHWHVANVVRYHRKLSSILNSLRVNGFQLECVLEPHALEEAEQERPWLLEERRRPPFLAVKASKRKRE
jgi:SAM-dependent methyltransferase